MKYINVLCVFLIFAFAVSYAVTEELDGSESSVAAKSPEKRGIYGFGYGHGIGGYGGGFGGGYGGGYGAGYGGGYGGFSGGHAIGHAYPSYGYANIHAAPYIGHGHGYYPSHGHGFYH